jgi:hypothetical protein
VVFHSYVSLPEGMSGDQIHNGSKNTAANGSATLASGLSRPLSLGRKSTGAIFVQWMIRGDHVTM